jgi:osmotically-inducible protein OsmY
MKSNRISLRTLAVVCGVSALPLTLSAAAEKTPSDADITSAVENALLFDSAVPSFKVDVSVAEGVATLDGRVSNILAKDRAVKIAESVRGVRAVVDRLELKAPDVSDEELSANVKDALLADPATDSYELSVTATNGAVTLSGSVDSWQEKRIARQVARGVRGVRQIDDKITFENKSDRSAGEIKADIERMLEIDSLVNAPAIKVDVKDGVATLSGTTGSLAEKHRAIGRAWVPGILMVNTDNLAVEPWAAREMLRETSLVIKSDEQVKEAVRDAFLYDPRVKSFNPTIEVKNGVVTLTGVVDNLKAKRAAGHDARNTVGVVRVENKLSVKPVEPLGDEAIAKKVNDALRRNAITDSYEITPRAAGGVVTLTGTVDSFLEKSEAEDVAQKSNGVVQVVNNLDVQYPSLTFFDYHYDPDWDYDPSYAAVPGIRTSRGDAEIKANIESEFFWSPFVDGEDITVTVDDGVATLSGDVDDWEESISAAENAKEAGAVRVVNELAIK